LPDSINHIAVVDLSSVSPAKFKPEELIVLAQEPDEKEVERLSAEFEKLIPVERYRGKFNHLFFMKWLELLCADRKEQNPECFVRLGQPRVVPIQGITLGMLASKSDYPAGHESSLEPFSRRATSTVYRNEQAYLDGPIPISMLWCARFFPPRGRWLILLVANDHFGWCSEGTRNAFSSGRFCSPST
jgi:hypothetical protein